MDFQKIYRDVKDKKFPELNSKFKPSEKIHFMRSSSITGNIYYNSKTILAMGFSKSAIKGVIAHELGHQVDFKKRGRLFFGRVWDTYKCSRDELYRRGFEREADKIAVERGYGKEYLEAMQLTKKMFPKNRWGRYKAAHLSMAEMKQIIKMKNG